MKIAKGEISKTVIIPPTVETLLGPPIYTDEDLNTFDDVGVATGLAWTAVGGQVLYIESTKMKGKGLTLTGQLGEVMKESAQTAIGHIRSKAKEFGIEEEVFDNSEIHVHLPAGAVPKDGPSAGITLATSIVSLLTGLAVDKNVAMTGEITLTGKVLPIGGLKEKALAAMRMNIKRIIIPWKNQKDLVDIPDQYRKAIEFIPVKTFEEVLEVAIVGWDDKNKGRKKHDRSLGKGKISPMAA
jgi:ATP-dependent Lon protease